MFGLPVSQLQGFCCLISNLFRICLRLQIDQMHLQNLLLLFLCCLICHCPVLYFEMYWYRPFSSLGAMLFFAKCAATFSVGIYEDSSKLDRPFSPNNQKSDRIPSLSSFHPQPIATVLMCV